MKTSVKKFGRVQLRARRRKKTVSYFISYTVDGVQKQEILKTVPLWDTAAQKAAIEECSAVARKRDGELDAGIAGALYLNARRKSFFEFAALVMRSKRTPQPYHKSLLKLRAFLAEQGKSDLTFEELTPALCIDFRDYLASRADAKEISGATAAKYLEKVRHIVSEAMKREIIVRNPFLSVKPLRSHIAEREFLTLTEIETLLKTPLPPTRKYDAQLYADFFLFAALTGIRPTDVRNLTWQNIGRGDAVAFTPSKTKRTTNQILIVPLHPFALKILERRRNAQSEWTIDNKVFDSLPPASSPNAINAFLKNWLKAAGIQKKITTYNARHSFASNLILSGAGIVEVSKLLGHTSLRHTGIYSHVDASAKTAAVNRLRLSPTAEMAK